MMYQTEHKLILALCKFLTPDKNEIEALMQANVHWPYVLGQLLYHRMGGAAYCTLREMGLLGSVNREFRNTLKTVFDSGVVKSDSLKIALCELSGMLRKASFPYALLKGAFLVSVYPAGLRTSNDLDILIRQQDITPLETLLRDNGFSQGNVRNGVFQSASRTEILSSRLNRGETVPFIKQIGLPQMEFWEIDINFSLDFKAKQENELVPRLLESAKPLIQTANGPLSTLSPTDFLIHLCCHLYKEASIYAWVAMDRDLSLYKFADLYLLLQALDDSSCTELADRIRQYGLQKECYYAFVYTRELFGTDSEQMDSLLNAIQPEDTAYLKEVLQPEQHRVYRYTEPFTKWIFLSGRKERLHETTDENA